MSVTQIFDGQSADGNSTELAINGTARFKVYGTFGGGTVSLQMKLNSSDDSFSNTGDTYTEDAVFDVENIKGSTYRLNLSGSTGASLDAFVEDNK